MVFLSRLIVVPLIPILSFILFIFFFFRYYICILRRMIECAPFVFIELHTNVGIQKWREGERKNERMNERKRRNAVKLLLNDTSVSFLTRSGNRRPCFFLHISFCWMCVCVPFIRTDTFIVCWVPLVWIDYWNRPKDITNSI